jgi:MerR family transcriptional regulator, redox-sensitive transcriptional activator SoxR
VDSIGIGEVARRTGVAPSAIRYYEAEGLLSNPSRKGGKRAFSPAVVDRVVVIRMARELGFSLADIRTLMNGFSGDTPPPVRWRRLAAQKLPEVEATIQRAEAMKRLFEKGLRCDCLSLSDCIVHDCNPPVQITLSRAGG